MEKIDFLKKEIESLLKKMIDDFQVEVKEKDNFFQILIKSELEAATIIGRHGETIRSIQKIIEVMFYKKFKEKAQILVNVNNFREEQKEKLYQLAKNTADKVIAYKAPLKINNLSSYERKIVHEYIVNSYPQLTSYSQGEGKERVLIVALK